ncbi:hypothetical protein AB838_06970 [Rhodobacteraceae bacterium (ex Bugula neritina AB1)]|nr:hypothetical protein AB838_06970 [Rhodobacteraceae bacterium (ex Bugula neritina AB1)]
MNVFVLGTGRCGTTTFMRACKHVSNFTTAHESQVNTIGANRMAYPDNHIEADNRLSWFLGRLDEAYGKDAFYVHMMRDETAVARSYLKRWKADHSIIYGYRTTIVPNPNKEIPPLDVVRDMCQTVNANVTQFLKDKPNKAVVHIESAEADYAACWDAAGFEGDREAALAEWSVPYNASAAPGPSGVAKLLRIPQKLGRIAQKLPDFLDRA